MNLYIKKSKSDCFESITVVEQDAQQRVYSIQTPGYSTYLVKLFDAHPNYSLPEEKILYMAENQPTDMDKSPNVRLSIPIAAVYDSSWKYCGYVYPQPFEGSISLSNLTNYQRRPMANLKRFANKPEWHDKFERDEKGMKNRFKMLYNLSKALHTIPEQYVPAYISPDDILITATGKITIDNLQLSQVTIKGGECYPVCCITPEYVTKSFKQAFARKASIPNEAVLFSYAVIFYQVLTGIHPYSGTILKAPYDNCSDIGQCIDNELFAFGNKAEYISFPENFNLHNTFHTLPESIKSLFKQAFATSELSAPPLRIWGKTLYDYIATM